MNMLDDNDIKHFVINKMFHSRKLIILKCKHICNAISEFFTAMYSAGDGW